MRIHKTQGKGDWIVVQLKPQDIFRTASYLYKSLEEGSNASYFFYNVTEGQQFRIEVRSEQRN